MGYSYGYNREEDAWDYNSTQSLVLQLIDKVSRGGNFLLDIGPDEHGKIPPIMQERLLQIGDWLKINGQAIYETSRWKMSSQWSEGRRDYKDRSGDMLLKITIDPDPGFAVKQVFYTYNQNNNSLFAILPQYPDNKKIELKDIQLPEGTTIQFLSTNETVSWKQQANNVEVLLPDYNPNKIKTPYAFVLKINNFGKFTSKPQIKTAYKKNESPPVVTIAAQADEKIHYTTDGSEPSTKSDVYTKPFTINKTSVVKAIAVKEGSLAGAVASEKVIKNEWMNAVSLKDAATGIGYKYYEPNQNINLVSAFETPVIHTGIAQKISLSYKQRAEKFAFYFFRVYKS